MGLPLTRTHTVDPAIRRFLEIPSNYSVSSFLRTITAEPHVAGTAGDYATALFVASQFKQFGLDEVSIPYVRWMSRLWTDPNRLD